jgi:PAS domain S-box-containing protein
MTAEDAIDPAPTREAWLRAVINSAGAVIVCTDVDCRITEFNPAAERVFGRRRGEVAGLRYSDLFPSVVRTKIDQDCGRVLGGEPIDQFENTVSDADGHMAVLLWDVRSIRDANGRAEGIVFVAQDITARRGTEASLERRKREMHTLTSLHRAMVGTSEPGALAAAALAHLAELVECSGAAVYAFAGGAETPQVLASIGTPPDALPSTHAADLIEEGEVVLPLVAGGEQVGLLYVGFAQGQELTASQRAGIAAQIADRLAAALQVSQQM